MLADEQVGGGQRLCSSYNHYTLCQNRLKKRLQILRNIFYSQVDKMTPGIADNDLVRFVLQSRSLHYSISLPFMPHHELNAERIMGKVQCVFQSNKQVDLQDGMQVHVVHVTMPQGGWASRKRKEYGFKLSKLLGSKRLSFV